MIKKIKVALIWLWAKLVVRGAQARITYAGEAVNNITLKAAPPPPLTRWLANHTKLVRVNTRTWTNKGFFFIQRAAYEELKRLLVDSGFTLYVNGRRAKRPAGDSEWKA